MENNTPVKCAAYLIYISFTHCFCCTITNPMVHLGLVIRVARYTNLNQASAEKSNFPYHKILSSQAMILPLGMFCSKEQFPLISIQSTN